MNDTVSSLLTILEEPRFAHTNVISWGAPVPSFGDIMSSRVATLGLNPSNREFVDSKGNELSGADRRFHTLQSLGIPSWSEATRNHIKLIIESCKAYFSRNPYDGWFRQLDHIISGTTASYYDSARSACHLDLIPFATSCKWTDLTKTQRSTLLSASADALAAILRDSSINMLVLNGRSVVEQFQEMASIELSVKQMPEWALRRGENATISGFGYKGYVRTLAGVDMKRDILILGFNHNIQSSFGVTNKVRDAIRNWVTSNAQESNL